ncbi:MAG: hypothetical protein KBC41_03490 [Candidatus Pacebacteria bacterium]|nr:hypothetical protein [Candidatus Paceibacterota bacterium]MBP9867110.1 hypothetical protein [Candidatus Paceibacterota bacterium]
MLSLFIRFELSKILKYFKTKTVAKIITLLLFMMVFGIIALGVYEFFVSGFRFIRMETEEEIRLALILFLYEVFLLVLSVIIICSTIVSSIFLLFRGTNNTWLMSSPAYTVLPKVLFIRTLQATGLPMFVIFLPAILAFNTIYHLGLFSVIGILFAFFFGIIFLQSVTFSFVVGVSFMYYIVSKKIKSILFSFKGLLFVIASLLAGVFLFVWSKLHTLDILILFKENEITNTVTVETISQYFFMLPTHELAMLILNFQTGNTIEAFYAFLIIVITAVSSVYVWFYISKIFYPLWQKFQEGTNSISKKSISDTSHTYYFTGSIMSSLYKKEFIILVRNVKGVMWFLFLLSIWSMQIAANHILGYNIQKHGADVSHKSIVLQSLQYIIAVYFISAFTLRFVFPSFSTEKKTMWILSSSPIDFRKVFFGKYIFFVSFFVLLGVCMNYINSIVLQVSSIQTFYSMALFISVVVFIVTLGLVFGALFPNTETDDPEAISTSMSGLFFTAFALTYGALTDYMLYLSLSKGYVYPIWVTIVITLLLTLFMLYKIYTNKRLVFEK